LLHPLGVSLIPWVQVALVKICVLCRWPRCRRGGV